MPKLPKDSTVLKNEIMEACITVFNEKGLKFTMDDVAKACHVSKKTMYVIFADKEDMFYKMVDFIFDKIKTAEAAVLKDKTLSTADKIKKVLCVLPEGYQERFEAIKKADAALENYKAEEQWYSRYLLPITYQKTGKKMLDHFLKVAEKETDLFLEMTEAAQPADKETRMAEALSFAQGLLDNGGPAINQFVKLFGRARTEQIVKECMYGVR